MKTEKKYANMIKNYNETKRRTSELETVSISLKNEVKKLKAEMGAMVAMIKPTVKETEKAVSSVRVVLSHLIGSYNSQ